MRMFALDLKPGWWFCFVLCFFSFSGITLAEKNVNADLDIEKVVNVYNWPGVISDDIIHQFEKETGIKVNYSTYTNNEALYAKLKANPEAGYDVVFPSTYFVDRLRKQKMIQKLDKSKLPNFKNIAPEYLRLAYDPENDYGAPFLCQATGIIVNDRFHDPKTIKTWEALWDPQYRDQLLILDDTRDVFSMAFIALGLSPNNTDPVQIKQAFEKIKALLPNIKIFNVDAYQSIYIDEDITLGMGWNGHIYLTQKENPHVQFIYPEDGFILSMDSMVIPIGAKHPNNAHIFINFMMRAEIAKQTCIETGFPVPNAAGIALLPPDIRDNPVIYPDAKTKARGIIQTDVGDAVALYEKYYELLKLGG